MIMGQIIYQKIYTCDLCGKTPKDGEKLWHMGCEVWCEKCCKKAETGEDDELFNECDASEVDLY